MMEKPVLSNPELDERLLKEGHVIIPFLTVDEVQQLVDFYYQFHPRNLDGMYATAHVPDLDLRMKMNDFIKGVFKRAIAETFVNSRSLGGSYIAKGKGERGSLTPHQDWNIVDEEQFRSFNIWVPLVDLKENNGAILILPGSHTWIKSYRSANINSAYSQCTDLLWKEMEPRYMKAGEALIYDHRMLHASGENSSDEIRLAAVYGIIPEDAEMRYYHKSGDNEVEVFESNPDFFLYGNIFEGPKGLKSLQKIPHQYEDVSVERYYKLAGKTPPVIETPIPAAEPAKPKGLLRKLAELFS